MKRLIKSRLFCFILGFVLAVGTTVYATNTFFSYDVKFDPDNEDWNAKNVDEALNDLYDQCNISFEKSNEFYYTGAEQTYTIPKTGKYKLEVWGAQGGSYNETYYGGYGGYSVGEMYIEKDQILYIYVGGKGISSQTSSGGGYNGGGNGIYGNYWNYGGGGATHIAKEAGLLSTFESKQDKLIIVAGGGGGVDAAVFGGVLHSGIGGAGGGAIANDGTKTAATDYGTGATQLAGGKSPSSSAGYDGSFGQGGNSIGGSSSGASGGGGGYYGGGAGGTGAAGGGSGYIGSYDLIKDTKHMYCYNCTISTDSNSYTISNGTSSCHNSSAEDDCAKEGNGHARITYIGK